MTMPSILGVPWSADPAGGFHHRRPDPGAPPSSPQAPHPCGGMEPPDPARRYITCAFPHLFETQRGQEEPLRFSVGLGAAPPGAPHPWNHSRSLLFTFGIPQIPEASGFYLTFFLAPEIRVRVNPNPLSIKKAHFLHFLQNFAFGLKLSE